MYNIYNIFNSRNKKMGHNGKLGQKYSKVRLNILQMKTINFKETVRVILQMETIINFKETVLQRNFTDGNYY